MNLCRCAIYNWIANELFSPDRKVRDKAVESLTLFLRSRTDLSVLDLLKLWKGLFFCMCYCISPAK